MDSEAAVARMRVEDMDTANVQNQEDMRNAGKAELTTRQPETAFDEMLNAIGDSMRVHASSDDEEDVEDEDDAQETGELGKLNEADKPGWVIGTISKSVQQCQQRFRQKEISHDELMHQGRGDEADSFFERDMKYWTAEFMVPAVLKPQTEKVPPAPEPMTFWDLMETLDIIPGQSSMPQGVSRTGSLHKWQGSEEWHSHARTASLPRNVAPNSSPLKNVKHV